MGNYHIPVLLQQVCTLLDIKPGARYVDATLGGGGHTKAILAAGGKVLGIDQDLDAIENVAQDDDLRPALSSSDLVSVHTSFEHLKSSVEANFWQPVSGVLFDLGVSLHQFTKADRGFSFQANAPLDMRMDRNLSITAADLLNTLSYRQLVSALVDFGEVKGAGSIAQKIISARPVTTTGQLASLLPYTVRPQVFQAIRIAVNDELGAIEKSLPQAFDVLESQGRLIVISFHSLEDRLVKRQFSDWEKAGLGQELTSQPIVPDPGEIERNPQSRSAKLRVFQKS